MAAAVVYDDWEESDEEGSEEIEFDFDLDEFGEWGKATTRDTRDVGDARDVRDAHLPRRSSPSRGGARGAGARARGRGCGGGRSAAVRYAVSGFLR